MNQNILNNLEGQKIRKTIFQDFYVKETLINYDFPLLLWATSPKNQNWLFKWCDTDESSGINLWIAFWVSESRLEAIKNDKISLREAVTLPEKKFYIFEAKDVFKPIRGIRGAPEMLPKDCLPSDDLSVSGSMLKIEPPEGQNLKVRLHVFSKYTSEGRAPLAIISPLQNTFQDYMTWTGHVIIKNPKGRVPASFKDWSGFDLISVSDGSFKMECKSNSNSKQTETLSTACDILANLANGTFDIESFQEKYGEEFSNEMVYYASLLARFISKYNLSLSLSWASSDNPNGYLALDKRRVDNFLNTLQSRKNDEFSRITLTLTSMEANPIRKPVRGTGGMQSLLRNIQRKLERDNSIVLSLDEIEKVLRYGLNYGQGGFQDRLVGLARALKRVGISFHTA